MLSEKDLDRSIKFRDGLASFPTVATERRGVFETFVEAAGLLVEEKVRLYGLGQGEIDPAAVAEGARRRLWEILDHQRGRSAAPAPAPAKKSKKSKKGPSPDEEEPQIVRSPRLELTFDEEGKRSKKISAREKVAGQLPDMLDHVFSENDLDVDLERSGPCKIDFARRVRCGRSLASTSSEGSSGRLTSDCYCRRRHQARALRLRSPD